MSDRRVPPGGGFVIGILLGLMLWVVFAIAALAQSPAPMNGLIIPRDSIVNVDTLIVAQYDPPAIYRRWWLEVQSCTHLYAPKGSRGAHTFAPLDITDFSWIGVPGHGFIVHGNTQPVPGWAVVESRTFLILTKYIRNERLVKHEMAHALMWENGDKVPSHMGEFWTRCELMT